MECRCWKLLYDIECEVVKVNNTWSLTMLFVRPLPAARRMEALEKVRLQFLFFASKGLVCKDEDVCWRHVGCRDPLAQDLDIILIDLGSLEHVNDQGHEFDSMCHMERLIDSLRKRVGQADSVLSIVVQQFASIEEPSSSESGGDTDS